MPADKRFNLRDWLEKFSDTSNTNLRDRTNEVARRLLQLLPGGDPGDLDPPGPPTNLVAFGGVVSVSLTWVAPPDLDVVRYRVQRSTTSGSGFSTITETPDTTFVDSGLTGGTTYYYQVAAIDDAGNVGDYSAEASATATPSGGSGTPPLPPAGVSAGAGDTVIDLSWSIGDPTAVATRVLRGTATGGPYTQVATGLTGTSWQDTGLTNGTEYFYVLRHVNANGDVSANSSEVSATPVAETNAAPSTPTGFVVTPKYLSAICAWNANPEADIAKYRVTYGSAPDALSDSIETTGTTVTITGLTQAATYYFSLVAIDTADNESDPVDVTSKVILAGSAPASPTPPATPSNFRIHAEGDRQITFRWTANTELDLARYNLNVYALTNTPPAPGGTGWVSIVANIGPGATEYVLNAPWLVNDQTYWFSLSAVNTSGQFSLVNAGPIAGTPTAQTGGGGGGTYEPPPGGGTGTTPGAFNGDTGLGARHKAPGANFDFVIDRSEYTGPDLFNSVGVALNELGPQGFNLTNKRVAILLPSKNYRIQYESNSQQTFNFGRRGIGIGDNQWYQERMSVPNVEGLQLHFIGPYPGGDLSASVSDAVNEDFEFELSSVTQEGQGWAQGSANQGKGMISIGITRPGCRVGFWFTKFNVANWAAITWGNPNALPFGFITLYGCRFVQPYHFSNIDSTNLTNQGGTNANAFMPRFQVSTYGVAIDQFHYNYMDCPYTAEHHIYERNPPFADCYITNSTFLRTGGNIWQQTRRLQGSESGDEGPDTTNGQLAGTQYWRNCLAMRWGRSWWSSGAIELKNAHRNLDMEDCDFVNDNPGCAAVWPPPNLATIAADDYCDPPYSRNSGNVTNDAACSWLLTLGGETGSPPMTVDGHFNGTARLRNVRVWIRQPQDNTFNLACARSFDAEDCVVLQTVTGVGVGLVRAGNPSASPTAFNTFNWRNNNVAGDVTAFKAAYTEVPASGEVPGSFEYRLPGAGQGTGYIGNGRDGTIITMGGANLTAQIVLPGNFGITQII